ncbi:hypothetical protein [Cupriavidus campinensis]|uniref:PilZ domain-containing protein n=1 Tax=Cupriavidus campinensis TaxID=151783 RepID=A0ABY3EJ63_9BURK|nr:hypothetical protein [Cupriavidus campinensis]TSP10971.1 hypothetical protein FGG12_19090 [Cupriavidus campinensis]
MELEMLDLPHGGPETGDVLVSPSGSHVRRVLSVSLNRISFIDGYRVGLVRSASTLGCELWCDSVCAQVRKL